MEPRKGRLRVLLARHLMEGHDLGIRMIAMKCRDYGMEVVYLSRFFELSEVVRAAQQEDADVIGLTSSSGAHLFLAKELLRLLAEDAMDIPVIIGGVVSTGDDIKLKKMGIKGVFGPGSTPEEAATSILQLTSAARD
jgi:methylmalonyl-CoA mutase C-terminal domain/subunit